MVVKDVNRRAAVAAVFKTHSLFRGAIHSCEARPSSLALPAAIQCSTFGDFLSPFAHFHLSSWSLLVLYTVRWQSPFTVRTPPRRRRNCSSKGGDYGFASRSGMRRQCCTSRGACRTARVISGANAPQFRYLHSYVGYVFPMRTGGWMSAPSHERVYLAVLVANWGIRCNYACCNPSASPTPLIQTSAVNC